MSSLALYSHNEPAVKKKSESQLSILASGNVHSESLQKKKIVQELKIILCNIHKVQVKDSCWIKHVIIQFEVPQSYLGSLQVIEIVYKILWVVADLANLEE